MTEKPTGLILTGTSHSGKSTLARQIGDATSWQVLSTDQMARHPGRPWQTIPAAVQEYYLRLSDETIHWFLQIHHQNMQPLIRQKLEELYKTRQGFILEGAALRPEYITNWPTENALVCCLYVKENVLRERIKQASAYNQQKPDTKIMTDKFLERSLRENEAFANAAHKHNIPLADTSHFTSLQDLTTRLITCLNNQSDM